MAYGMKGFVGFAKESSGGTVVATTNYIEATSEDVTANLDRFEPKNIIGDIYEADDSAGVKRIAGNVVFPVNPADIGHFLLGALGVRSGSVVGGNLIRHEFTPRRTDWDASFPMQPWSFEIFRDVTSSQRYSGINMAQLNFSIAPNQELRCTAALIGKTNDQVVATTASYVGSTTNQFTFDTCSLSLGGTALSTMEGFELSINNQLEGVPTLNNSTEISRIRRSGPIQARLQGTINFERIDEYNDFLAQTERQFRASFFRASSFSMVFDLPRFVYSAFPLSIPGRGRLTVGFQGMGRLHTGSNQAIKIDLFNVTSAY